MAHPSRCAQPVGGGGERAAGGGATLSAPAAPWWLTQVATGPGSSQDFNPRLVLCQVWISHWLRQKYEKVFFSKIADSTISSQIFLQCSRTRAERNNGIARDSVATLALERSTRLAWSTSALITPTTSTISTDTLTLRRDTLPRAP